MSVLNKPYELSIWEDVVVNNVVTEQKLCIIGSHTMVSQSRALQPKLVSNINGTNTFSFMIYYRFKDTVTGEEVDNPFAQYLTNERKLKLNYGNKWYDFIIKNIKIDSNKHSYDITATDQYINELSKNGFNLTFDAQLRNNLGTIQYLAQQALEETDWVVPDVLDVDPNDASRVSEFIADRQKESLVNLTIIGSVNAYPIIDDDPTGNVVLGTPVIFTSGNVLGFYSCCKSANPFFSFIYAPDLATLERDDERVIKTKNCQYIILNAIYQAALPGYGIQLPTNFELTDLQPAINNTYRGARYVYAPLVKFNTTLQKYVTEYTKNGQRGYGFTDTTYEAPNFIQNWVTNPNKFTSTAGWNTATLYGVAGNRGKVKTEAIRNDDSSGTTLIEDLKNGVISGHTYEALLKFYDNSSAVAVNTGFYDSRTAIQALENGTPYIIRIRSSNNNVRIRVGQYTYDSINHIYTIGANDSHTFLDTDDSIATTTSGAYKQFVVKVKNATLTPNEFMKQYGGKVVIIISGITNNYSLFDFQIYEGIQKANGNWMTPEDQATDAVIVNTSYIYDADAIDDATVNQTRKDFNYIWKDTREPIANGWQATYSFEKCRGLTIKESNYYNIIQVLCENFECWAEYYVEHDNYGNILSKQLYFHNYTGDYNYAGFRYGVNLKSITRTDDSKQIVSKLIVKQNSNEFGEHGFCTIARAPSNETGETYIYNIDYYINQGLLAAADWNTIVYDLAGAQGKDLDPAATTTNSNGYYVRLATINEQITYYNEGLINRSVALSKAKAEQTVASNGLISAKDNLDKAANSFQLMFGVEYTHADQANQGMLDANINYLVKCAEAQMQVQEYTARAQQAITYYETLKTEYETIEENFKTWCEYKKELNRAFYAKFYRYVQEGTWISEDYYDDELYYLDATSVLYNSSVPKATYNISVLELSQLIGYEDFTFGLGDRTYVEDPEFFGYDDNGMPIREQIVLTEITYNLDSPDKNSIKVQNYKSQFQDLFKRITATVQSVQYSTGSYDKAADLANANDNQKSAFLQGGLNDAGTVFQNLANQTVRLDEEGLTITDGGEVNRILRAVSGGILLSNDGGNTWELGITAGGINAKTINSGVLNTGDVNIMYGDEPTFRWDAYGLTAYDFNLNSPTAPIFTSGVRFDRLGIYGFKLNSGDAADFHPTEVVDWDISGSNLVIKPNDTNHVYVRSRSAFELTREGLYLNPSQMTQKHYRDLSGQYGTLDSPIAHKTTATIGRANDLLFNSWGSGYYPYYDRTNTDVDDQFVQVIGIGQVGDDTGKYRFAVYDDGTVCATQARIEGQITASTGSIGGWTIGSDLYAGSGSSYVALSTSGIWAGNANMGSAPFSVTNAGVLTATNATITGTITASNGTIGGFTITASSLYNGKSSLNAQTNGVYIGTDGISLGYDSSYGHTFKVTNSGTLTAISGTIGGATINSARFYGGGGSSYTGMCFATGSGVLNNTYAFYAGATSSTGNNAKFLVLKDGTLYATAAHITGEITATSGTIGNVHIGTPSSGGTVGLYSINASMANTCGQGVSSSSFYLGSNGLSFDLGSTDSDNYHGYTSIIRPAIIMLYGNSGQESPQKNTLTYMTETGLQFYRHTSQFRDLSLLTSATKVAEIVNNYSLGYMQLQGTWHTQYAIVVDSDQKVKHNIEALDARYITLFDNLIPKRFKYNNGTSNRYHTGFIAQEVYNAALSAGLTSQEVGAICIDNQNTEQESWGLRYEELISILTAKIKSLEERIRILENKI